MTEDVVKKHREGWLEILSDYIDGDFETVIDYRVLEMISSVILTEFLQKGDLVNEFHDKRYNGEIPADYLMIIDPEKVKQEKFDLRPFIPFLMFNNIWKNNLKEADEELFKHNGKWHGLDIPVLMNNDNVIIYNKKKDDNEEEVKPEEKEEKPISPKDLNIIYPNTMELIANSLESVQTKTEVNEFLSVKASTRMHLFPNHPENLISQPYLKDLKRTLHLDTVCLTTESTLRYLSSVLDEMEAAKPGLSEEELMDTNLLYNCLQSLFSYVDWMIEYYGDDSIDIDFICQCVKLNNMYLIITKVWKYGELEELTSFFGFAHPSFIKESIKYH